MKTRDEILAELERLTVDRGHKQNQLAELLVALDAIADRQNVLLDRLNAAG